MCMLAAEFVLYRPPALNDDDAIGRFCSRHSIEVLKKRASTVVCGLNEMAGFFCEFEEEPPDHAGLVRICLFLMSYYGIHLSESAPIIREAANSGIPQPIPGTNLYVEFVSASQELWSLKRIES